MKKFRILLIAGLMLLLWQCNGPCEFIHQEFPLLTEAELAQVPYADGDMLQVTDESDNRHFFTIRRQHTRDTVSDECQSNAFDQDLSLLESPTVDFDIAIWTQKLGPELSMYRVSIDDASFPLPLNQDIGWFYWHYDSLLLKGTVYYDVFEIKSSLPYEMPQGEVYADSLWYNQELGILKLLMSDGASFDLKQEDP